MEQNVHKRRTQKKICAFFFVFETVDQCQESVVFLLAKICSLSLVAIWSRQKRDKQRGLR